MGVRLRSHLTFANVVSVMALFIALSGGAYALSIPKDSVGTKQLKDNAVKSSKVKNHSLLSKDFKVGQVPAGKTGPPGAPGATGPRGPSTGYFADTSSDVPSLPLPPGKYLVFAAINANGINDCTLSAGGKTQSVHTVGNDSVALSVAAGLGVAGQATINCTGINGFDGNISAIKVETIVAYE